MTRDNYYWFLNYCLTRNSTSQIFLFLAYCTRVRMRWLWKQMYSCHSEHAQASNKKHFHIEWLSLCGHHKSITQMEYSVWVTWTKCDTKTTPERQGLWSTTTTHGVFFAIDRCITESNEAGSGSPCILEQVLFIVISGHCSIWFSAPSEFSTGSDRCVKWREWITHRAPRLSSSRAPSGRAIDWQLPKGLTSNSWKQAFDHQYGKNTEHQVLSTTVSRTIAFSKIQKIYR